ncbi:MAG: hypothetical protein KGM43_01250, partial [Planctomycetota bacterium]|nr:hypothetical protein [Planctomycetota bacterium]
RRYNPRQCILLDRRRVDYRPSSDALNLSAPEAYEARPPAERESFPNRYWWWNNVFPFVGAR